MLQFLTREPANHRARSLICILWWKRAVNLEKPLKRGVDGGGDAVFTVVWRQVTSRLPVPWVCGAVTFLTSKYVYIYLTTCSQSYGNYGALVRRRIKYYCRNLSLIHLCSRIFNENTRQVASARREIIFLRTLANQLIAVYHAVLNRIFVTELSVTWCAYMSEHNIHAIEDGLLKILCPQKHRMYSTVSTEAGKKKLRFL